MERTKIQNDQVFMLENEIYSSSIGPSVKREMWRDIQLYGDVHVKGGIFGKSIHLAPKTICIEKAVFCRDGIEMDSQKSGMAWFRSLVHAGQSILIKNNVKVRFCADIHSPKINLKNAIVYGNIFCDQILIDNCVVLGAVFAKKQMKVSDSILGTCQTEKLYQKGNLGFLMPFGISEHPPVIEGKILNLLAISYESGNNFVVTEMDANDVLDYKGEEGSVGGCLITPTLRYFDLTNYTEVLRRNLDTLTLLSSYDVGNMKQTHKNLEKFDNIFFNIIANRFQFEQKKEYSDFMRIPYEVLIEQSSRLLS